MLTFGPASVSDGWNQDGETIDQNGIPQSGVFSDTTGLINAVSAGVANVYRAVNQPNQPVVLSPNARVQQSTTGIFSGTGISGLIVPGLVLVALFSIGKALFK